MIQVKDSQCGVEHATCPQPYEPVQPPQFKKIWNYECKIRIWKKVHTAKAYEDFMHSTYLFLERTRGMLQMNNPLLLLIQVSDQTGGEEPCVDTKNNLSTWPNILDLNLEQRHGCAATSSGPRRSRFVRQAIFLFLHRSTLPMKI